MDPMRFQRRFASAALLLALVLLHLSCGPSTPPLRNLGGIDPAIVAKWEKAGFQFCWFGEYRGVWTTYDEEYPPAVAVPGFLLDKPFVKFAGLPDPGVPFGIRVRGLSTNELAEMQFDQMRTLQFFESGFGVDDSNMQNLARRLPYLRSLKLNYGLITNASLPEIAQLKELRQLDLSNTFVRGDGLHHLSSLTQLKTLNLREIFLTDAAMSVVAEFKELEYLDLELSTHDLPRSRLTDYGMKQLAALTKLRRLSLANSDLTDAGLREIAKLDHLEELDLSSTRVTGDGIQELSSLQALHTLNLINTSWNDAGLKELAGLQQLRDLNLQQTQITDAGLKAVAQLKDLQILSISDTVVTDIGLAELTGLQKLEELYLLRTKTTLDGVKQLDSALKLRKL